MDSRAAPRVLIVDDSEMSRTMARREVIILGFSTLEAASGTEALEIFARTPCDAVLMDCRMPGLDGYETTRRLRQQESGGRRAVVIALTGDEAGDDGPWRQAGMDAVVAKSRLGTGKLAATLAEAGLGKTGNETLAALDRLGRRKGDDLLGMVVAAHYLAGAASVVGVGFLGQQCTEAEALARRGEIDTVGERLPALMAAWERAETELRTLYSLAPTLPA